MRGACIDDLGSVVLDKSYGVSGGIIWQAKDCEISLIQEVSPGGTISSTLNGKREKPDILS